ncbi:MAG: ABC transporter [Acidobacteria bacterium]|nr:MAG: ABC transporter [Acidobacteriota bacterium]
MSDRPVVSCDQVSFSYGGEPVLDGVSLEIATGEFVAITGPNGGGKSTLFELMLGLLRPSGGSIELLGVPPRRLRQRWRVGYVPQRPYSAVDFPATVAEVVSAGRWARLGPLRFPGTPDKKAVSNAMEMTGISDLVKERVGELSGGQQQRVHLARALASEPDLIFLDEPMTGVDLRARIHFKDVLAGLCSEHDKTVVLIAHEYGPLADLVNRLIVLAGAIKFDGPPPRHEEDSHHHHGLGSEHLSLWDESEALYSARDDLPAKREEP